MNGCEFKKARQYVAELERVKSDLNLLKKRFVKIVELDLTKSQKEHPYYGLHRESGHQLMNERFTSFIHGCAVEWHETRIDQLKEELCSLGVSI